MLFDRWAFEDHKALSRRRAGRAPWALGIVLRGSDKTNTWGSSGFMERATHAVLLHWI